MQLLNIQRNQPVVLVGHFSPDYDCIVAMYLFAYAIGRRLEDCLLRFTRAGSKFTGPIPDGAAVVHTDCGGPFSFEDMVFDHHAKNDPYRTAASAVFYTLFDTDNMPRCFHDLIWSVEYVDDVAGRNMTDQDYAWINRTRQNIPAEMRGKANVVVHKRGPLDLPNLVNNWPDEVSDEQKVLDIGRHLDAYFNLHRTRESILAFAKHYSRIIAQAGIRICRMDENGFKTKNLRYILRSSHLRKEIDVVVTIGIDPYQGTPQFNVTIINDQVKKMTDLREKIELFEGKEVFLHERGEFCLYWTAVNSKLTLDQVVALTAQTLRLPVSLAA